MNKTIEIQKDNVLTAYKTAKEAGVDSTMKVLEALFGKELFKPKNIMERIKTFDDAFKELGENHPLVKEYHKRHLFLEDDSDISSDLVAYLKLRIITAALNEGWTPQFTEDEYRYFPWFWLYTKEEIVKMDKEERKKIVLFGGLAYNGAYAGFAFASTYNAPSATDALVGSRLCFKSSALAKYAGEQFAEIYFAFMGK
jgi:hypothetical protein